MNILPLFDRVIIKPNKEKENKTKSGILLASISQEKQQLGKVVAVGEGGFIDGKETNMQVKVGDKVIYARFVGNELNYKDEFYLIMKQTDILAIIKE